MSEAATPAVPADGTPPVAPAATPAVPVTPASEMVTLTKEAHDQLARDAARAGANQSKADRYDRMIGKKGSHFGTSPTPATPPSPEEAQAAASEEDRKAERGLLALAADPALRSVLDADPTLRDLLTKNPLAVLPIYANDALDADDAVSLVRDALLSKATPVTPPVPPPPPAPPTPPAGGVNPDDRAVNDEVEAAKQLPNTEHAIAGMIKARTGGQVKK